MALYDEKKRGEYKIRMLLSTLLFFLVLLVLLNKRATGPAAAEIAVVGFTFCFGSFGHSLWALRQIKKNESS